MKLTMSIAIWRNKNRTEAYGYPLDNVATSFPAPVMMNEGWEFVGVLPAPRDLGDPKGANGVYHCKMGSLTVLVPERAIGC
jgi:hypothetical protein